MSRFERFLHLERPRADRGAERERGPRGDAAGRFEGVACPGPGPAPAPPSSSGADLERFGDSPEPPIELVEATAGERPFTRCARCGMDHNVFAVQCSGCGASLDTDAQRAFNERLWARRQEEASREARAAEERRALAGRAEAELAETRRAMGEELAREVGERERLRLGRDGALGGGLGGAGWDAVPLGLRLLRLLPDRRWRLGAIGAALAAILALVALGRAGHPGALVAATVLALLLVAPPGFRGRRR